MSRFRIKYNKIKTEDEHTSFLLSKFHELNPGSAFVVVTDVTVVRALDTEMFTDLSKSKISCQFDG